MARHQKPTHNKAAATDPEAQRNTVERLIESGKAKEAFKEAKLYYHRDASAENRHLVERTYLVRIRTLIDGRMTSAGQEVAQSALEFGIKDPSLMRELILLLPQVGLADKALALQEQFGAPELRAELMLKLADRAVVHPESGAGMLPELHAAAEPVRQAFVALDANNDARALELLQAIPRSSPMADWRYFVRGLVAFRQNDREQATANWDRLNPQRAAQKIARALLAGEKPGAPREQLTVMERSVYGEPVLDRLAEFRAALERADWNRVLYLVGPLRQTLNRIDPRHSQRLTDVLLLPLASEIKKQSLREAQRLLGAFKAALEPLPWDPKWHRFEAILWEGPQGGLNEAVRYWQLYLQDLEQGAPGLPGELRQVQALVWLRIGELTGELADEADPEGFPFAPRRLDLDVAKLRDQSTAALQQSLRLYPKRRQTHQLLIDNYSAWDQPERMVAALEQMIEAFPDDIDALKRLIHERQLRDEPEHVLKCVARIRKLKPLDPHLDDNEAWGRLALARHLALKSRWDEARAEFAHVETALKGYVPGYRALVRRAALEFKAGDTARAEELVAQARLLVTEPTALWLALTIELIRYKLPKALAQRFDREFKTAVAKKVTSETAGALAELIGGYFAGKVEYTGRAGHTKEILRYLKRTTRLTYQEPELRRVCMLLESLGDDDKLLGSLVKRGRKLFPRSPFFLKAEAEVDMRKGPLDFNPRHTQKQLEQALALAQASQNPEDSALIPGIKDLLSRVRQVSDAMASFPFGGPGGRGGPDMFREMFEMMSNQFGGMDGFEDEPDDGLPPTPKRKRK